MPIRPALYSDLWPMAEVLAAAFNDEELNAYFFPHRKEYPEDYVRAWYQVVATRWWDLDSTWLVSYDASNDDKPISSDNDGIGSSKDGKLEIMGVAQWARTIAEPGLIKRVWKCVDPRRYIATPISFYFTFYRRLYPNRAIGESSLADPQPLRKWDFGRTLAPFANSLFAQPSARHGHWELEILGVHQTQHKRGYATELIRWGIGQAREESLPAVVIMASGLEKFYARHGFQVLVGYAPDQDIVVQEKDESGNMVERTIMNPLKQRGLRGGGVAWTKTEADL